MAEQVCFSPLLIEFLSLSLARFIALSAHRGQRWTKSRIAEHITASEAIPGKVDDTTIGRFLDPASKQVPSAATLNAVAAFLIEQRALTADQVRLAGRSQSLVEATAFATIIPVSATSAAQNFLSTLVGRYDAIEARGSDLLASALTLSRLEDAGVLVAQEVISLFHIPNMDQLKRETRNFTPGAALDIWPKLRLVGGREVESTVLSGFVMATPDIMALLMRGDPARFQSIVNVREIAFGMDERVAGFSTWRNLGWRAAGTAIAAHNAKTTLRSRLQSFGSELEYRNYYLDKIRLRRVRKSKDPKNAAPPSHNFFDQTSLNRAADGGNIAERQPPAGRLIASIDNADLDGFRAALAEGADPNIRYRNSLDPIVFMLAADGREGFVEALITTGRCRLTGIGSSGFPASHAPGVTARLFAPTGPAELVAKFRRIALMFREEEIRQLRSIAPGAQPG